MVTCKNRITEGIWEQGNQGTDSRVYCWEGRKGRKARGERRCSSLLCVSKKTFRKRQELFMPVYQQAWHGNGFAGLPLERAPLL